MAIPIPSVSDAVGFFTTFLYSLLGIIVGVGVILWVMFIMKFKHRFRVKIVTGGKKQIVDDKARVVYKDKAPYCWQLFKRKHIVPMPPAEAIEMTTNGKMSVEAYYTEEGEYIYSKDVPDLEALKTAGTVVEKIVEPHPVGSFFNFSLKQPLGKYIFITDKKKPEEIKSAEPITSSQRAFFVNHLKQAHEFGQGDSLAKKLIQHIPIAILGMIIILGMVFAGDLADAWNKIGDKQLQMQDKITESLIAIKDTQRVEGKPDPQPPPD